MQNIHHSVCSVIPPYVLQRIAEHDGGETGRIAGETLDIMESIAAVRQEEPPAAKSPAGWGKRRNVYDAHHERTLPDRLVMNDHKRRGRDVEVNEAYDGSGATYDFYAVLFDRRSFDGRDAVIESTVHFGNGFDNAFWNGRQMIYGDGKLFTRFTGAVDVIGHELTHGVIQHAAGLGYVGQTGALNEHIADAFGIMVKQFVGGELARASNWLIGERLYAGGVRGRALRSMSAPGTAYDDPVLGRDPQPAHMRDYRDVDYDAGGVHINSGIPNHAFYLAAIALGGYTWEVLGRVWYVTLTQRLSPNAGFQTFADTTVKVAGRLYGKGGYIEQTIADAWDAVGIPVGRERVSSGVLLTPPRAAVDGRRTRTYIVR